MADYEDDDRGERDDDRGDVVARAKAAVKGPAIGLIVTGVISILLAIYSLVSIPGLPAQFAAERKKIDDNAQMPADQKKMTKDVLEVYEKFATPAVAASGGLGLLVGALTAFAGLKLKGLQGAGMAKTASVLSMIPCISPCCPLGLGIGIWVFVTLGKPDVKAGFQAVARSR